MSLMHFFLSFFPLAHAIFPLLMRLSPIALEHRTNNLPGGFAFKIISELLLMI